MIVTEDQARKLICPVRPPLESGGAMGTVAVRHSLSCVGSRCMWWEWVDPTLYLTTENSKWMPDAYLSADLEAPKGWCARGQGR